MYSQIKKKAKHVEKQGKNEVAHYSYLFPPHPTHVRNLEPESGLWRVRCLGAGTMAATSGRGDE